jgi:hypothetical protein
LREGGSGDNDGMHGTLNRGRKTERGFNRNKFEVKDLESKFIAILAQIGSRVNFKPSKFNYC